MADDLNNGTETLSSENAYIYVYRWTDERRDAFATALTTRAQTALL